MAEKNWRQAPPRIGDKITYVPNALKHDLPCDCDRRVTGTVVWIHPKGRFYLVEVEVNGHKWHEALPLDG